MNRGQGLLPLETPANSCKGVRTCGEILNEDSSLSSGGRWLCLSSEPLSLVANSGVPRAWGPGAWGWEG